MYVNRQYRAFTSYTPDKLIYLNYVSVRQFLFIRRNHIFFVHFIMLHMKQLNSYKTCFPRFDKILVI